MSKEEDETGDWRKLHNASLFVLLTRYCLGNQTGNDVVDWAHGTYYKLHTVSEWESLNVRDHLEGRGVDQKTELKWSAKDTGLMALKRNKCRGIEHTVMNLWAA